MRKLSVLHVALGGRDGGAEAQSVALLAGLVRRGHRALGIVRRGTPLERRAVEAGAPVFPLEPGFPSGPGGIFSPWSRRRLAVLSGGGWDVIHHADPASLAATAGILGRGGAARSGGAKPPPSVVTWRGGAGGSSASPPAVLRRHHREGGRVHVASEAIWSALVREGFDEDRLTVVHAGIPMERHAPDRDARARARRRLGLDEGDEAVGTVAILDRSRGVEELLEAMVILNRDRPRARLVVIGGGPRLEALRSRAGRSGTASPALFTGWSEEVPLLLRALDVYVFPGRGQEVFPLSLVEAMAAGVPVVVCDQPGIREIIENGKQGLFVPGTGAEPLARTIFRALADGEGSRAMGKAGAVRVQRFSTRAMVDGFEKLYYGMVKAGGAA